MLSKTNHDLKLTWGLPTSGSLCSGNDSVHWQPDGCQPLASDGCASSPLGRAVRSLGVSAVTCPVVWGTSRAKGHSGRAGRS